MTVKKFVIDPHQSTNTDNVDYNGWCKESCDMCHPVREIMLDDKHIFDGNVWMTKKSENDINILMSGEYVMGDLCTLVWVVVNEFVFEGESLLEFHDTMAKLTSFNMEKWHSIQNNQTNEIKYPHFFDHEHHEEVYKNRIGVRRQRWAPNHFTEIKEYPMILRWFNLNLDVASKYVKWNTMLQDEYVFTFNF